MKIKREIKSRRTGGRMSQRSVLAAAIKLAAQGFRVAPMKQRAKRPINSGGFNTATTDEQQIRAWLNQWPDANIGIATGDVLLAVDVDPRNGGLETLAALQREHGEIPSRMVVRTGGGGLHIYCKKDTTLRCSNGLLGPGIDIKADGGGVVAPPSIHESGRRYMFIDGLTCGIDELPQLPDWIVRKLRKKGSSRSHRVEHWRNLIKQGVSKGNRANSVTELAGHLLGKRVDPYVVLNILSIWNQQRNTPPLSDEEIFKTVESIAGRELNSRGGR